MLIVPCWPWSYSSQLLLGSPLGLSAPAAGDAGKLRKYFASLEHLLFLKCFLMMTSLKIWHPQVQLGKYLSFYNHNTKMVGWTHLCVLTQEWCFIDTIFFPWRQCFLIPKSSQMNFWKTIQFLKWKLSSNLAGLSWGPKDIKYLMQVRKVQ